MNDEKCIERCLELAKKAEGRTSPNPMVGALVLDSRGHVVGEGYHLQAGKPHAEVMALQAAGSRAQGGTLYVNLEPCNHQGRTPPCAPQIAASKVARVVFGMSEPIASHAGGGDYLRAQGIEVKRDLLREECEELNRAFRVRAALGRPWVTSKVAMTLDGKLAIGNDSSQWITGPAARRDGHRLRNRCDAIVVGIGTVILDNPQLTTRGWADARDPLRVIFDTHLRTPTTARVLPANTDSPARCVIACARQAALEREKALLGQGAEVWRFATGEKGRIVVTPVLERLAHEDVMSLLLEGGAGMHGAFLAADAVDELRIYIAPLIARRDRAAPSWVAGSGAANLVDTWRFTFHGEPLRVGDDLALTLRACRAT